MNIPLSIGLVILGLVDVVALGIDWLAARVRPGVFLFLSIYTLVFTLSVAVVLWRML